ncbi:MAG: efflux RND transporter periplasmic adaptor subunit, partial [Actinobacteria bacterium]|nr:efflux RND transporter periplasmic adaptor subunit [Actinomycetota bacterium]
MALLAVVFAALFGAYKMGWVFSSKPTYKTVVVSKGDLSEVINASGMVESENQATITFLASGRVSYVGFKAGDIVKKGDIIASLDSVQARDAVSKAEATFKSAQSSLNKVLDDIHLSQYGNGGFANIGTANETMTQKNDREAAEMTRDGAYQDLQSARKNLEWSTIIAPFDGVISDVSGLFVGQNVSALSPGNVTVVGSGDLKFVANVDEIDFANLVASQSGEITIDAFPEETLKGIISKIGVAAIKLAAGGSVVPVDVTLPQHQKLKAGLNGEVNFTVTKKTDVIVLPKSSVRKDNSTNFVYLLIDGKPVRK